tara:strand:+ start:249 stop:575 length:327 start_codon:yes stop_codon:yes gene_type:complete
MSFHRKTTHKAIKPHRCAFCCKEISVGETYGRVFIADCGDVWSYKIHSFCDDIAEKEHRESGYDDLTLDMLLDCARDKVQYVKDNADIAEHYGITVEQVNFVFGEVAA